MTGPAAIKIVLSEKERFELEARVRRRKIARADAGMATAGRIEARHPR